MVMIEIGEEDSLRLGLVIPLRRDASVNGSVDDLGEMSFQAPLQRILPTDVEEGAIAPASKPARE